MQKAEKVKFVDGKRCPQNAKQAARLPECGIFDRDEFTPVNRAIDPSPPSRTKVPPFTPGQTLPQSLSSLPKGLTPSPSQSMESIVPISRDPLDSRRALRVQFPATGELPPPRGYTRVPDLGQFEMDALPSSTFDIEAPRTRLFESNPSGSGLRRRLVGSAYTSDARFTQQPSDQLQSPIDSFSDEFAPPRGTPSYPADDLPPNVTETNRFLPKTQIRDTSLEPRAKTAVFMEKTRADLHENAKTLLKNIANTASEVQEGVTMRFADQYRHGYRQIARDAQSITGVDMPQFDIESQEPIVKPSTFKDGSFEIEQGTGRSFASEVTGIKSQSAMDAIQEDPFEQYDVSTGNVEGEGMSSRLRLANSVVPGMGAGLLFGYGVSAFLGAEGVDPYSNAFVSGAAGDIAARWTGIGVNSFARVAGQEVSQGVLSSLGKAAVYGAAEGGIIGLASGGLDIYLSNLYHDEGFSHALSNALGAGVGSSFVLGGIILGSAGAAAAGWGTAAALAPETLGASVVIAGISTAIGAIIGANQDAAENEKNKKINDANTQRLALLSMMPSNGYDIDKAVSAFKKAHPSQYTALGVGNSTWDGFTKLLKANFSDAPKTPAKQPADAKKEPTEDEKKVGKLYTQYVSHSIIQTICKGKQCALSKDDPGALSADDLKYMNSMSKTWKSQADLSSKIAVSTSQFHYTEMVNAQDKIVSDYIQSKGSKTIDKQEEVLRKRAFEDPTFKAKYDKYIAGMNAASKRLAVTIPQLIELQSMNDLQKQKTQYKAIQFDNAKANKDVVEQAKDIITEESQVQRLGFYDIDSAFLQTDPTSITKWNPSDAQILQASNSGMTLQQYIDYLSELQKGEDGDPTKLQAYTNQQITSQGVTDYAHLQDELRMAGLSQDLYSYDPRTRKYTLNPHVSTTPDMKQALSYQSKFTPAYLTEAREEYAKMVTNMNNTTRSDVADYNSALRSHLVNEAYKYQQNAEAYNIYLAQQSTAPITHLLSLDVNKLYSANALDFHPLSTTMPNRQATQQVVDQKNTSHQEGGYTMGADGKLQRVIKTIENDQVVSTVPVQEPAPPQSSSEG